MEGYNDKYECLKCGFFIKTSRKRHSDYCKGNGPKSKIVRKTKKEAIKEKWKNSDYRNKVVSSLTNSEKNKGVGGTEEKEQLRITKIREKILKRYSDGWEPTCGRCKKYDYYSPMAGNIKVDGKWELKVAEYLDSIGVTWKRNTTRFDYLYSGKVSSYCPDFFVEEWNSYIEVKGYETEKDREKWKQFPQQLVIWKKEDLLKLKILE